MASARASRSSTGGVSPTSAQRPPPAVPPADPRRRRLTDLVGRRTARRSCTRERMAAKPSAVSSPRATPSHSASSMSLCSRPVSSASSARKRAPLAPRSSTTSAVAPTAGTAGW